MSKIHIKPTLIIQDYKAVTLDLLQSHQWTTVFADIDNTLIGWDEPDTTSELREWTNTLRAAGVTLILVSNNNENRIRRVAEQLEVPYVYPAMKPLHRGFHQAMLDTDDAKERIVMIGDQLLTDMLGAGTFNIATILVRPLKQSDAFKTRINRFFERFLLQCLYGKHYDQLWEEHV